MNGNVLLKWRLLNYSTCCENQSTLVYCILGCKLFVFVGGVYTTTVLHHRNLTIRTRYGSKCKTYDWWCRVEGFRKTKKLFHRCNALKIALVSYDMALSDDLIFCEIINCDDNDHTEKIWVLVFFL